MGMNKNTWTKDYTGSPGLKKLGKQKPKTTDTKKDDKKNGKD